MGTLVAGSRNFYLRPRKADTGPTRRGPVHVRRLALALQLAQVEVSGRWKKLPTKTIPHSWLQLQFQSFAPFGMLSALTTRQQHSSSVGLLFTTVGSPWLQAAPP